ncbi:MAG: hypothetical protein SAJ37_15725 [Oscillatoria sp. PMC 1068.18]|nr:hypothetical protein [Oscillatoria sp. PMC 1076.18]MEC4990182.1 hypothetical protein [Oscillatoria sp. PMC 1068.18]
MNNKQKQVSAYNLLSLSTLLRAIKLSEGQFTLILVRCNYQSLKQQISQHLDAVTSLKKRQIFLAASTTTLFTTLQTKIQTSDRTPLFVFGLESVTALEKVLMASNQVRDEFRKNFHFPLILWVNDEGLQKLTRFAPDFKSWAATSIKFELDIDNLQTLCSQTEKHLFKKLLRTGCEEFLPNQLIDLAPSCRHRRELEFARTDLQNKQGEINSEIEALWQFILGRDAFAENKLTEALNRYEESLANWEYSAKDAARSQSNRKSRNDQFGFLQYHIALCYTRQIQSGNKKNIYFVQAKSNLQASINFFRANTRLELVAQLTIQLGLVLLKQAQWEELSQLALSALKQPAIVCCNRYIARIYGFLAQVALAKCKPKVGLSYAKMALNIQQLSPLPKTQNQGLYLFLLAQAQNQLANETLRLTKRNQLINTSIVNLERAKALEKLSGETSPELYLEIIEQLISLYLKQEQYLLAFQLKQEKISIEQNFGLRAFLGASPLGTTDNWENSAFASATVPITLQKARLCLIAASGRKKDLNHLIERLSRSEHKLTVLHGASGVGKSSLLAAGLIPALSQEIIAAREVLPILHKLGNCWEKELDRTLNAARAKGQTEVQETNLSKDFSLRTIIEKLHLMSQSNLFTVLIFDQFEEFFLTCTEETERHQFYQFLRDCLNLPFVKVILSLREDYLHYLLQLENFGKFETIDNDILSRNIRYQLGDLSTEQAKAAIKALANQSQILLAPELIEVFVQDLARERGRVRPIELQVMGAQLQAEKITTLEGYQKLGSDPKTELITRSLLAVIADCGKPQEDVAWQVLFALTDEQGTRPLQTKAQLLAHLQTAVSGKKENQSAQIDLILTILLGSGLLFQLCEEPENRYQLVHDYLVQPIREQYNRRLKANLEAKLNRVKSELVRIRKQRLKAVFMGSTMALLAMITANLAWRAEVQKRLARELSLNAELNRLATSAETLFVSHKEFDALLESLRAAKRMQLETENAQKQMNWRKFFFKKKTPSTIKTDTKLKVITTLEKSLYGVQERNRLEGHADLVLDVAYSPDGKYLATASRDRTLKLWQPNGSLVASFTGHKNTVTGVAFAPNGKILASSSWDGTVRIWRLDGKEIVRISADPGYVLSIAFSPDGKSLVSAGSQDQVNIWNLQGKLIKKIAGNQSNINQVRFSPDGKFIATAGDDGTVKIWQSSSGKLLRVLRGHKGKVKDLVFSPQGDFLATAGEDRSVRIWRRNSVFGSYQIEKILQGHQDSVLAVCFSPDGYLLASGSDDRTVKLWNLEGKLIKTLPGHSDGVTGISFSPRKQIIATSSNDKTVKLWSRFPRRRQIFRGHTDGIRDVDFSPNGKIVASASSDRTIKLWRRNGSLIKTLQGHQGQVDSVSFSPDGERIATASEDKTVKIWQKNGSLVTTLTGHKDRVLDVSWSRDGRFLATASRDRTVKIWSRNGSLQETLLSHQDRVNSVAFSLDNQILATASDDKTVKLWRRSRTGYFGSNTPKTLFGHNSWVLDVSFAFLPETNLANLPVNQLLASAGYNNSVKLWNLQGQELKTLQGHTDSVAQMSFNPTGEVLATTTWDNEAQLWRLDDTLLQTLQGHSARVTSVSWSRDGQALVTGSNDKTAILWNLDLSQLMQLSCNWLADYLENNPKVRESDRLLCDSID